jgi:DNA ligase-1
MTSQRKRKHGVEQMAQSLPLKFFIFDLLFLNGEDWTGRPYAERRAKIVEIVRADTVLTVAEAIQTERPADVEAFFDAAVGRGLEGIVAKRLDAPYAAGARNFNWIKLKRSYRLADSLDLCIVGYWAGQGQRAAFGIGTILGAVYNPANDRFYTVSKIGSGFSEDELVRLKTMLDEAASPECPPQVCSEIVPDVWVHPKYVVAVTADEITRSQIHSAGSAPEVDPLSPDTAGYALRFPRVQGFVREDKNARDATTVDEVIALFQKQGTAHGNTLRAAADDTVFQVAKPR